MTLMPAVDRIILPVTFKYKDNCIIKEMGATYSQAIRMGGIQKTYTVTLTFKLKTTAEYIQLINFFKDKGSGIPFQIQWLHIPNLDIVIMSPDSLKATDKDQISVTVVQQT